MTTTKARQNSIAPSARHSASPAVTGVYVLAIGPLAPLTPKARDALRPVRRRDDRGSMPTTGGDLSG